MSIARKSKKKSLGLFHLIMINVIAVDSIRTLPFSASYGYSLVFFYLLATLFFLIPTALVSAELGTGWPVTGGVYVWVREAFGKKWSFLSIWLQWIYNVVWYPTIIALVAGTATYLMGLEMVATHSADMKQSARDYPRSLFISVIIIFVTIITASLAIAIVVPVGQLNLATGAMQAFTVFLHALGLDWAISLVAGLIILGGLCGVSAWIIGPTKGMMVASQDGSLPAFLGKKNQHGVPLNLLLVQGGMVTVLSFLFVFFPTINSSFWILSVITAQLSLIVYILLFASAIKLHHFKPKVARPFVVPGKTWGMWVCSGVGILCCILVFILGFFPPVGVGIENIPLYEIILIVGILGIGAVPLLILKMVTKR